MEKALQHGAFMPSICGGSSIVHASVWRPAFGVPAWRRQDNTWYGWRKNRPACRRRRSVFPVFPHYVGQQLMVGGKHRVSEPVAQQRVGNTLYADARLSIIQSKAVAVIVITAELPNEFFGAAELLVIHTRCISHCRTPAYSPCAAHRPPKERRHRRFFRSFPSSSLSAGRGHFSKAQRQGILSAPFSWR